MAVGVSKFLQRGENKRATSHAQNMEHTEQDNRSKFKQVDNVCKVGPEIAVCGL
jgi:hypothetical protein